MTNKPLINGEAMNAALETTLAVELFLNENYAFRRNELNGKVEFMNKPSNEAESKKLSEETWRPLTQEVLNSIIRRAKEGETPKMMNTKMLLSHIQKEYPSVDISHENKVRLRMAMTNLEYEYADRSNMAFYKVIPLRAA